MRAGVVRPKGRHERNASAGSDLDSPASSAASLLSSEEREPPPPPRRRLSSVRLATLAVSTLGVQIFWSILMSHGTPYLQSLGFSSSLTSLVWLAGPLVGAVVQPIMGAWSDGYVPRRGSWAHSWGRRTPFLVFGALGTIVCLVGLANVRESFEVLGLVGGMSRAKMEQGLGGSSSPVVKVAAVVWVYLLNVLIQPLQVGVRAFAVDSVPSDQQVEVSAWISRWNSFGAVLAFWLGSLNLPGIVPVLGDTQFKVLSVIEITVLVVTVPVSLVAAPGLGEKPVGSEEVSKTTIRDVWRTLYRTYKVMPQTSWMVCKVQFWAWLAWFPFLYYNTVYIGGLNASSNETSMSTSNSMTSMGASASVAKAGSSSQAAQTGSFASFLFALLSLAFTLVLPPLTRAVPGLTVERLWFSAHVLFALIMGATYFVQSVPEGTALVACLGFSWAMTQWAPYALISDEVSRVEERAKADREAGWAADDDDATPSSSSVEEAAAVAGTGGIGVTAAGAGAIFGLHNVAMSGPQVIAAVGCAVLFKLLGAVGAQDSVGCVLRFAGLAALGAAWVTRRLGKRIDDEL